MKLISVNIENNLHNKSVSEFLKKEQADIVCLQELLEEDFDFYKKELDLEGVYQVCSYYGNEHLYLKLKGKKQGLGIFARDITASDSFFYLGQKENILKTFDEYISNESFQQNHAFLWATVKDEDGSTYKYVTTHLPVTKNGESTPYQLKVAEALLDKLNPLGEFVLCGDMNTPRGGKTFNLLEKIYKNNIPLEYKTSIDQNLHRVKGIQLVVDHLFTTPSYKASNVKLADGVSDHLAIVAEINKN